MVVVFPTKAKAKELLKEIAVTPFGAVILWAGESNPAFAFDATESIVGMLEGADGRCAVSHPFGEDDAEWLRIYLAGQAEVLDGLPGDWVYPESVL